MSIENILQQLDTEITNLKKVRAALSGLNSKSTVTGMRIVSTTARRKMAKAQRVRWARVRAKAQAKKRAA